MLLTRQGHLDSICLAPGFVVFIIGFEAVLLSTLTGLHAVIAITGFLTSFGFCAVLVAI